MIFPFLRGFLAPHLAPVTYFLVAVNVFVYLATLEAYDRADAHLDTILNDRTFISTQGLAFSFMIHRESDKFSPVLRELADKVQAGESDVREDLGRLALRNPLFTKRALFYPFDGDEIALAAWKKKFADLISTQKEHPSYLWGLSSMSDGWKQWVSYQFAHSGFTHLFWNMLFLVLFGCFVERELGSSFVILTYLGGGLAGAYMFSELSGVSSSPLVGASAAVTGLMGLVGFHWRRSKVRFFYWLLPVKGYFGFLELSGWIVVLISLLPDLTGYLSSSRDLSSIAYSAHIGGAMWGMMMSSLISFGIMQKEEIEEPPAEEDRWAA